MKYHAFAAELIGTFLLAFLVRLALSGGMFPVATPVLAALTLGLIVYTIGPVSGAHVNPAVTIGLWSIGKIAPITAFGYIISQFIGAGLAAIAAYFLLPAGMLSAAPDVSLALVGEAIGAAIFLFGISAVVRGRAPEQMSGVVVGTSLLLGVLAASTVSAGILNPAVALALNAFSVTYAIGPVIGALAGVWLYRSIG